jgi:hypothetical protein
MRTDPFECPDCGSEAKFKYDAWPVVLVWRDCIPNCLLSDSDMRSAYENELESRWEKSQSRSGPDYAHIMAEARKVK